MKKCLRPALALSLALACHSAWAANGPACQGSMTPSALTLYVGKSALMHLPEAVAQRSVGNPNVAQAMLVTPDTMYLVGVDLGSTNLIVQGKSGACTIVDLTVTMDTAALQAAMAAALPDEKGIQVQAVADSMLLTGMVSDVQAVQRAVEVAQAFARRPVRPMLSQKNEETESGKGAGGGAVGASISGDVRVINMLSVAAPQQVMLEVKVAEVSKTLLEKLESGTTLKLASGSWLSTVAAGFLTGGAKGHIEARKTNGNVLALDAQTEDSLVRVLAEPTVMAISGQEGSFLAGGKFYIPIAQDNNRVTLQEKEFGIGLRFTPTVLAGGRINLFVAPEVSELSRDGIGITAGGGFIPAVLPVVTTRRASTTVQLFDGQSFAIGGLIKNNLVANMKGLPFLADIPILGALFRSTDYQRERTELVFVITSRLVKPLLGPVPLPTDKSIPPTPAEFMFGLKK